MSLRQVQQHSNLRLIKLESRIEREILLNYTNALRAVNKVMRTMYAKYAVDGVLSHAEMTRYNRAVSMRGQLAKALQPYTARNVELVRTLSESQYEASFYRTAWSLDNEVGTALRWGQIPTRQVRASVANKYMLGTLKALPAHERLRLQRAVSDGLIRGRSMPAMMRDIRGVLGVNSRNAMRIARTEAHRAREIGHLAASGEAAEQGVDMWRVWDAALDDRTRSSHAELDGKRVRPGEPFVGTVEYPGGFGIASDDINCRCTVTDEVEGFEPTNRRVEGEVQPYRTFGTWAREHGITGNRYGQKYNFI